MKLWLDDVRPAPEGWSRYTSSWDALDFVLRSGNEVTEWSLDHDLGAWVPTGYSFLCMIELLLVQGLEVHVPEKVIIHSANPVGSANMRRALTSIRTIRGERDE